MFKKGDKVKLSLACSEYNTGIIEETLLSFRDKVFYVTEIDSKKDGVLYYKLSNGFVFPEEQLIKVKDDEDMEKIYFSKVKDGAKIPNKESENSGYDVYSCFDEDYMIIEPHKTKMIPTGLASSCSENYTFVLKERGSTGTKGIAQRCGIIDSGYRNEWFVPLTNTNDKPLVILKNKNEISNKIFEDLGAIVYPYEKAICQVLLLPVPKVNVLEIPYEDLKKIESKRGMGALGSSGK